MQSVAYGYLSQKLLGGNPRAGSTPAFGTSVLSVSASSVAITGNDGSHRLERGPYARLAQASTASGDDWASMVGMGAIV